MSGISTLRHELPLPANECTRARSLAVSQPQFLIGPIGGPRPARTEAAAIVATEGALNLLTEEEGRTSHRREVPANP
jgi:hypothetical protein